MTEAQDDTIRLACWDCNAIYASPKDSPQCPNCGWKPQRLVLMRNGVWADPATVIVGVPYDQAAADEATQAMIRMEEWRST
jgi:hypothetical protein